jgi:hypothetical protein
MDETLTIRVENNINVIIKLQEAIIILTKEEALNLSNNLKTILDCSSRVDASFDNTLILESCPKS